MRKLASLVAMAFIATAPAAHATLMTAASLFTPLPPAGGATTTYIDLSGVNSLPSQSTITTSAYKIEFSVPGTQGVVKGTAAGLQAIPVAGVTGGGDPLYLINNLNQGTTSDPGLAGKYLSTGGSGSAITITFTAPQTSFALLWGSIDPGNQIKFGNATGDVLNGATVKTLAGSFVANGFQGPAGSAYVSVTSDTTFKTVAFTSDIVSFEFAGAVASDTAFVTVPEPMSLALLGAGLTGLGLIRRRA